MKFTDYGPGDEITWPAYRGHPNDPRAPDPDESITRKEAEEFLRDQVKIAIDQPGNAHVIRPPKQSVFVADLLVPDTLKSRLKLLKICRLAQMMVCNEDDILRAIHEFIDERAAEHADAWADELLAEHGERL